MYHTVSKSYSIV